MEKVVKFLAALTAITLALAFTGCDSSDANTDSGNNNGGYAAPTLPPSVGTNPFKGKTFKPLYSDSDSEYDGKHVFSDDGETVTYHSRYGKNEEFTLVSQSRYTVNTEKETLSWCYEKLKMGSNEELFSVEDMVRYFENEYKAGMKEAGFADEEIAEVIKEQINTYRKMFSEVTTFSYTYDSAKGTLDLVEMFDEKDAYFYYEKDGSNYSNFMILVVKVRMYYSNANIELSEYGTSLQFASKSFDKDKKEIVFVNRDDDNDTFTATYKLTGSGSDTKLILSFMRGGEQYELTLDFDPDEYHWTEVK